MFNFGFHVSASGGVQKMPERVGELGGECFQFFARSPHGGSVKEASEEQIEEFKNELKKYKLENYYIHTPYFINLASKDNRIFYGSVNAIKEDLKRAEKLGAKFVVTHLGSAKDFKEVNPLSQDFRKEALPEKYRDSLITLAEKRGFSPEAFLRAVEGLKKIAENSEKIPLLIEISAGAGAVLGLNFQEIAYYLESVPALSGFCFDTAHAFASGYELRGKKGLEATFRDLEKSIGQEKLKLVHLNDSLGEFDSKIDRHAHLGEGKIGKDSFRNLVDYFYKENYNVDIILETPTAEGLLKDMELLKGFRSDFAE